MNEHSAKLQGRSDVVWAIGAVLVLVMLYVTVSVVLRETGSCRGEDVRSYLACRLHRSASTSWGTSPRMDTHRTRRRTAPVTQTPRTHPTSRRRLPTVRRWPTGHPAYSKSTDEANRLCAVDSRRVYVELISLRSYEARAVISWCREPCWVLKCAWPLPIQKTHF